MSIFQKKNRELEDKSKIIDLIGSTDFIKLLSQETISQKNFNHLFLHHVLAILLQSTGIKEMGVSLIYLIQNNNENKEILKPEIEFYFYTTKNVLVQSSDIGNKTSIKIRNKKHDYPYRDSISLRNFIKKYNKELFLESNNNLTNKKTMLYFRKNGKTRQNIENYYYYIIDSDPVLKSVIFNHLLKKDLPQKLSIKKDNNFKI